ncbi:hypothetical protein GCM10009640_06460 [Agrococcus citreus]|uniref:Uncharacterized protein n=1 Tax=Agrococcus citreus TaxID=84643 RepID=A0ABN1YP67_9MICO
MVLAGAEEREPGPVGRDALLHDVAEDARGAERGTVDDGDGREGVDTEFEGHAQGNAPRGPAFHDEGPGIAPGPFACLISGA